MKSKVTPDRSLHAACMGSMGLAASWLKQAESALSQGQSLNDFVAHSHVSNRRQAQAAYRLAVWNTTGVDLAKPSNT